MDILARLQSLLACSLCACVLLGSSAARASWIYMGVAALGQQVPVPVPLFPSTPRGDHSPGGPCSGAEAAGLVEQQLELCRRHPDSMAYVRQGAALGLLECQWQFQHDRWNCSLVSGNQSLLPLLVHQGTKETAFVHASTTAAVVHAVTAACSTGNLTDCACDTAGGPLGGPLGGDGARGLPPAAPGAPALIADSWQWGGCSDNINYGVWFAETFVDATDEAVRATSSVGQKGYLKALVNLHNNEVGRKVMTSLLNMKCRCHGVSGSCAVKTCWKAMPSFRRVGDDLRLKYENSVEISLANKPVLHHREKRFRREPIAETELVHVTKSPNYCTQNERKGIAGTHGRECKLVSTGPDSCHSLCCGRGHMTYEVRHVERCQCRFIWCCQVKCKTCETVVERHVCK